MRNRKCSELFIATSPASSIEAGVLREMRELGVGLILVDGDEVSIHQKSRNPAFITALDPSLRFGNLSEKVNEAIHKYNYDDRRDGLRDMCDLVEAQTERLLEIGIKKGLINVPVASISEKDWSEQIDTLASSNACKNNIPVIPDKMKLDMHSFRGARNLLNHKVRSKRQALELQRQFAERIVQGPRLLHQIRVIATRILTTGSP